MRRHHAEGRGGLRDDALAGGINLIMERSRSCTKELLDAIHADPKMYIAHLLWADPFTMDGHDKMVAEISAAAADTKVVMWYGPDEVDYNNDWAEAAGIRRILQGSSPALDALLRIRTYRPTPARTSPRASRRTIRTGCLCKRRSTTAVVCSAAPRSTTR